MITNLTNIYVPHHKRKNKIFGRLGEIHMASNNYFRTHNIHVRHHKHNNKAGLIVRADIWRRLGLKVKARVKK